MVTFHLIYLKATLYYVTWWEIITNAAPFCGDSELFFATGKYQGGKPQGGLLG